MPLEQTAAPAAAVPGPWLGRLGRLGGGGWFLLPQAVSRLVSVLVFSLVAHRVDVEQLGAVSLATAMASAAYAVAPAMVAKPLAITRDPALRLHRAVASRSAAVLGSLVVTLALVPAALLTHGLIRLALFCGIAGIPTVMIVESTYWTALFLTGARSAGLHYSGAYLLQAAVVVVGAYVVPPDALAVLSFAALALPALLQLLGDSRISVREGWNWITRSSGLWLPYVIGVSASMALGQAIPIVLSATAGFQSASTYRAGELVFGGTNLVMVVAVRYLLTLDPDRPRVIYSRVSTALALLATVNGIVLSLVPRGLVEVVIGPTAALLLPVLVIVTVQRAALAVSSVGSILLLPRLSVRAYGLLDVLSAGISMSLLVVGGLLDGLVGALVGLAVAEILLALLAQQLLRRDP